MSLQNQRTKIKSQIIKEVRRIFHFFYRSATGDTIRFFTERPMVTRLLRKKLGLTLEVGCGAGIYTNYLARKASHLVALDIQEMRLGEAKKRQAGLKNISFVQADAQELPFLDNTFNIVICTQVLEHIKDDLRVLKEIKRVLKDSGRFIISVPVPPSPFKSDSSDLYDAHLRDGYYYEEIKQLLNGLNFHIIDYEYYFFILARWAFKIINFSEEHFKVRPPGIFIAMLSLEDRLFSLIVKIQPYGLLIDLKKADTG